MLRASEHTLASLCDLRLEKAGNLLSRSHLCHATTFGLSHAGAVADWTNAPLISARDFVECAARSTSDPYKSSAVAHRTPLPVRRRRLDTSGGPLRCLASVFVLDICFPPHIVTGSVVYDLGKYANHRHHISSHWPGS